MPFLAFTLSYLTTIVNKTRRRNEELLFAFACVGARFSATCLTETRGQRQDVF